MMKKTQLSLVSGLIFLFFVGFSVVPTLAQAVTGTLAGTVVDSGGGVVANATVRAKNEGMGTEKTSTTNSDGAFSFAAMLPGSYTVTIEAPGFKRSVKTGVSVKAGITNPADTVLEAGSVSETVTVTANTEETLQTAQSQISTTIDTRKVEDLPANGAGGGIDTLALLVPGVIPNRVGGTNTNGTGLSVNGQRGRSNNFQIDGADNNDLSVGGPALFVDFQDSVQEYQVITNNFDARYGRNQGAIVNIVGKQGTSSFHGSAFWHHQDARHLNSVDNITKSTDPEARNDPNLWNVYGGTIGGPIFLPGFGEGTKPILNLKDRAFFFFAYQGIRNPASFTSRSTSLGILPTEFSRLQSTYPGNAVMSTIATYSPWAIPGAQLNDSVSGTPAGAQINLGGVAGCPIAVAVGTTPPTTGSDGHTACGAYTTPINASTGQPFLFGGPYDILNFGTLANPVFFQAAQYQRTGDISYTEDYWNLRFDVKASKKDNVSFRYIRQDQLNHSGVGSIASGFVGTVPAGSTNYGGTWTRNFGSKMLNDFRFFYSRIGVEFGGGCEASTPGCIPGPAEIGDALANIAFPIALGLTKSTSMPTLGPATNLPQGRIGKVYQYIDNYSILSGKHSMTAGFEFKHLNTIAPFLPNFNGAYSFNTTNVNLATQPFAQRIIANAPGTVAITGGDPTLIFKENDYYAYFQDDYKVKPNLTLNLGVRYEYAGNPLNQLHDITVARESDPATAFYLSSIPLDQKTVPFIPADKDNWAPRLGFAYTPHFMKWLFGEDATVFRGGFSIAYDAAFYNILLNVQNAAPFSAALNISSASLSSTTSSPSPLPNNPVGTTVRSTAASSGVLPLGKLDPRFLSQTVDAPDFRSPYAEQWSFGMQRLVGKKHIFEVRYVGTHGVALFQNINSNFFIGPLVNGFTRNSRATGVGTPNFIPSVPINFPKFTSFLPPGTTAQVCTNDINTPFIDESACNQRQFRQAGITTRQNSSQSIYHSMQARYNGRLMNDSLSLGVSYTWSKAIDDSSEIFSFGDISSPNAQNPFCINRCERGLSDLDRPHAASFNFVYDVPLFKEQHGIVGHLLGGWQLNGIYLLASGAAFTPSDSLGLGTGAAYLTAGDRPFWGNPNADKGSVAISEIDANLVFGAPLIDQNAFYSMNEHNANNQWVVVNPTDVRYVINGPGAAKIFGTPFGNVSRNTERGPIFNQLNFSVFKNINVIERVKVQLRAEMFNALNHPNPGFGVASGGTLPVIALTNAGVNTASFNNPTDISLANRVIQVGLRVVF